jgi:hypothetical protein
MALLVSAAVESVLVFFSLSPPEQEARKNTMEEKIKLENPGFFIAFDLND